MQRDRQEDRKKLAKQLYVLGDDRGHYTAVTVDISDCGVCMVTNRDVRPGQTVRIYSEDLWPVPVKARAVWRSHLACETSRVGLVICDIADN